MQDAHKKIADFYDNQYHKDAKQGAPGRYLRQLVQRLRVGGDTNVLDIACGTGEFLQAAAERKAKIAGMDISQRAIAVCRAKLPAGRFEVGVAESLPFQDEEFDLVTCLGSLEHFVDQPAALREMVRVLKPDGRVLILVPNSDFILYRLGLYRGTQQQSARETLRTIPEWVSMIDAAGMQANDQWRDLHVLSIPWIFRKPWLMAPIRGCVALMLTVLPLRWQYQVHFDCTVKVGDRS